VLVVSLLNTQKSMRKTEETCCQLSNTLQIISEHGHSLPHQRYLLSSDMKNSFGEEQEVIMNPGDMLYFPAGMCHSVETIEEGISINISLMSVNYASLVSSAIHHFLIKKDAWVHAAYSMRSIQE